MEIKFRLYREYEAARTEANNAMMAMLAGTRLALHTLQLTAGSSRLLPEIFPAVKHIERFNLTTSIAADLLAAGDNHLGAVAIPYALAIHEDFVVSCLGLIETAGIRLNTEGKRIKAWNMHEICYRTLTVNPSQDLACLHLLRHLRNSQIHEGGRPSADLKDYIAHMPPGSLDRWEKLTGRAPSQISSSGTLNFSVGDVLAAFAITKTVGRDINRALGTGLSREYWARLVVSDYASTSTKTKNSDAWMRSLRGLGRQYYEGLGLTNDELEVAARASADWTRSAPVPPRRRER